MDTPVFTLERAHSFMCTLQCTPFSVSPQRAFSSLHTLFIHTHTPNSTALYATPKTTHPEQSTLHSLPSDTTSSKDHYSSPSLSAVSFQLPMVNYGLKTLNGKLQKQAISLNCTPFWVAQWNFIPSHSVPLTRDVNYLFVLHIHTVYATHPLVT